MVPGGDSLQTFNMSYSIYGNQPATGEDLTLDERGKLIRQDRLNELFHPSQ